MIHVNWPPSALELPSTPLSQAHTIETSLFRLACVVGNVISIFEVFY